MKIIKQEITTTTAVVTCHWLDGELFTIVSNYSQTVRVGGEITHRELEFVSVNNQPATIKSCGGSEDSQMWLSEQVDKELIKAGLMTL